MGAPRERKQETSHLLARLVQIEKRGTVIGDRTAGAVMTARLIPHAVRIASIAFYATMITVGDVRMSDGATLEGSGVTPDEALLPSGAAWRPNAIPCWLAPSPS